MAERARFELAKVFDLAVFKSLSLALLRNVCARNRKNVSYLGGALDTVFPDISHEMQLKLQLKGRARAGRRCRHGAWRD